VAVTAPTGLLLNEDAALKERLQGFSVYTPATGEQTEVPVWFRFPDPEEETRSFPHLAIDLVTIEFEADRAHRAIEFLPPYPPSWVPPAPAGSLLWAVDMPLPLSLLYQIAAYSRQPWHDRQLSSMLFGLFPMHFGSLYVPADGTTRRADFVSQVQRDLVDVNKKRLYRTILTVAISSEMYYSELSTVAQALQINLQLFPTMVQPDEAYGSGDFGSGAFEPGPTVVVS